MSWQRIDRPLADLLEDLPTPPPRIAPMMPSLAPLAARYPNLSALPDEALTQLSCLRCGGAGRIGDGTPGGGYACADCRGTGLVCPRCRGCDWVLDHAAGPAGRRPTVRCQGCVTPDGRNATILAYVAAAYRTMTDAQAAAA